MKSHRISFVTIGMLALTAMLADRANAQAPVPDMIQVPIVTSMWGVPGTTPAGGTANASCSSTTPGYLDSFGNGCPANQATVRYLYSVVIDSAGDIATANGAGTGVRVLYEGGSAMAAMIKGALPGFTFTPMVGHSYLLTEGAPQFTAQTLTLQSNGEYYCLNKSTNGVALDNMGDGCPAQYVGAQARQVAFDPDGNLFFGELSPLQSIHVIYAGGARAASLIEAYNPSVKASGGPRVGYVYGLSSAATGSTDFITIGGLAVQAVSDTQENIFVSDRGTSANESGLLVSTSGNQIKEFVCPAGTTGCNTSVNGHTYSATGWATYLAGGASGGLGDGGPVAAASARFPFTLQIDDFGNLFIADSSANRIRVVYNGGTNLPLYSNNTLVTNPQPGYIYTVAGGGTGKTSPAAPNTLAVATNNFGVDHNGNFYFTGSSILWMESPLTGKAVAIGWMNASTTSYSANTNPAAGAYCNGLDSGPTMTDVYASGCPATEVTTEGLNPSVIPFDAQGNFYITDARNSNAETAMVFRYSYGNQFGSIAAGTSSSQTLAFTPSTSGGTATYSPTFPPSYTSTDFSDAGGDVCTTSTVTTTTQTCTVNVAFKPVQAGPRAGSVSLAQSGKTLPTILLGGAGTGAQISIDPASMASIGSGLAPTGVAMDSLGNTYISSGASAGVVLKSSAGGAPASFATGLDNPAQLASDGAGNVYVADSGNNRIAMVPAAGGAATAFLGGSFTLVTPPDPATLLSTRESGQTLSNPMGVAVDLNGNVYIADTGNNRVLKVEAVPTGMSTQIQELNFSGLSSPKGIAVDANEDVFVADSGNHQIVELSATGVQSVVSSGYTPSLSNPVGVAVDAANNLYVADAGNQQVVLLLAGTTTATPLLSSSTGLTGIAADSAGDVYVADSAAGSVTQLNRTTSSYAFTGDIAIGASSSSVPVTITNTGSLGSSLTFGSPLTAQSDSQPEFIVSSGADNGCTSTGSLTSSQQCTFSAVFNPQSISAVTSTVTFPNSNAVNPASLTLSGHANQLGLNYVILSPGTAVGTMNTQFTATLSTDSSSTLTGTVNFVVDGGTPITVAVSNGSASTTIPLTSGSHTVTADYNGADNSSLTFTVVSGLSQATLSFTPAAPTFGQAVTVTAAIATSNSSAKPTGTVTFTVNGVAQTPVPYAPTEQIVLDLPSVGTANVSVSYSGDANFSPASTGVVPITIGLAPTTTVLQVVSNVASAGDTITLTATVTPQFSVPAGGSVTFTYAGTTTDAIPLVNGIASFTTATSQLSAYTFTATYSGDTNYLGSSNTVTPGSTFIETLASSSLIVPQNSQITEAVQLDPFFGYAGGTIQISCTNLPANTVCTMSPPAGLPLGATGSQTAQLLITTNASPVAVKSAQLNMRDTGTRLLVAGGLSLSLCLVLPWWKQKRHFARHLMAILMLGCALAFSGCGSSNNGTVYQTPTGTYTINVVATDGTITSSQPLSLTVVQSTSAARPTERIAAVR